MSKNKYYNYRYDIVSLPRTYVETKRNHIGFFCQHCYHPWIMKYKSSVNLAYIDDVPNNLDYSPTVFENFILRCPKCGKINKFNFFLDPNITETLALLNRKGWQTNFSCEGHPGETVEYVINNDTGIGREVTEHVSLPYIWFYLSINRNVVEYIPLPKPWYLDKNEDEFIIRCDTIDMAKERLHSLYLWADALPNLNKHARSIFRPEYIDDECRRKIALIKNTPVEFKRYYHDSLNDGEIYTAGEEKDFEKRQRRSKKNPKYSKNDKSSYKKKSNNQKFNNNKNKNKHRTKQTYTSYNTDDNKPTYFTYKALNDARARNNKSKR